MHSWMQWEWERQALGKVCFLEKAALLCWHKRRLASSLAWGFLVTWPLQSPGPVSGAMERGERREEHGRLLIGSSQALVEGVRALGRWVNVPPDQGAPIASLTLSTSLSSLSLKNPS